MADSPIVSQLLDGLVVHCPLTGADVHCKPLSLKLARQLLTLWKTLADPDTAKRFQARVDLTEVFCKEYPQLEAHICGGDIEMLVPSFFVSTSGARVRWEPQTEPTLTGTAPLETTLPSGANSPEAT
jgi:hypothetical protein